ncbi:SH3 domain-containing protein [Myroides odoratimimus]|uniref:SH3 domain-containing protein n=1 Tax=Myroides odoratimimus TaxID=76832 RepID=UPI00209724A8|nr:SH3 domain-containing protein [Myroides odoratimimus]MCO7724691.1 SH3 domain-containing protein [Myroides odoratimimus]
MKQTIGILCFLVSAYALGQSQLYVSTPTVAYNDANGTTQIGVYTRGAYLENIEKINKDVFKVTNAYAEETYILDINNLKKTLSAEDTSEASPNPIIDFDDYYGSPHLFTTVGGLKVRKAPNHQAEVLETLYTGTPLAIDYYPYDKEAWVKVSHLGNTGYIPVKYLGKRPNLNNLITNYKKATDPKDQKRFIQRIVELGWNSSQDETALALGVFAEYADKNNRPEKATIARLQAEVLKVSPNNEEIADKIENMLNQQLFGFTLNNVLEPRKGFSLATLEKSLGKIKESYSNLDDCALGDYESNIIFHTAECIGHDVNKTYKLRIIEIKNDAGFKINNSIVNENTTEKEFLEIGKGLINTILPLEKAYQIAAGDMVYQFSFAEGKLSKVELIYFC